MTVLYTNFLYNDTHLYPDNEEGDLREYINPPDDFLDQENNNGGVSISLAISSLLKSFVSHQRQIYTISSVMYIVLLHSQYSPVVVKYASCYNVRL